MNTYTFYYFDGTREVLQGDGWYNTFKEAVIAELEAECIAANDEVNEQLAWFESRQEKAA